MLFKKLFKPALAFALASQILVACSIKVNNPAAEPFSLSVNALSGGCLADPGTPFKKFFSGTISGPDLDLFWGCLIKAFQTFVTGTKGANPGYYTPAELQAFVQHFFMKDKQIPAGFMDEAMALKQGILGGAIDKITEEELKHTIEIMYVMRDQSQVIRPYLPFGLDSLTKRGMTPENFEAASEALNSATSKIADALAGSIGTYSFDHLDALLQQMSILFYGDNPSSGDDSWVHSAQKYMKMIRYGKSILVAPPADVIQKSDWQQIFYLVPRYFTLGLRTIYYGQLHNALIQGDGLKKFEQIAAEIKVLLQASIANHPSGSISYDELDTLVDTLSANEIITISSETIKPILRVLFDRVFFKASATTNQKTGINAGSVDQMYLDFTNWSEAQLYLAGLFTSVANGQDINTVQMTKKDILAITPENALQWTAIQNPNSLAAIRDMQKGIDVRTIFPLESNWVVIPDGKHVDQYNFPDLSKLNIFRFITELLMRGYGTPQPLNEPSMTADQVQTMWNDFFPIVENLGYLSADSKNDAKTYMLEADMFTYAGVGNNTLSLNDALELEFLLMSIVKKAPLIHSAIQSACGATTVDAKGNALIDPTCYRNTFVKNANLYWDYIPGFAKYFQSQKAEEQAEIMAAYDALAKRNSTADLYRLSDTQAYTLIPYYIEIIFSKFDTNYDGIIDQKEGKVAYPTFERFLGEKATPHGLTTTDDWYALYTYMLRFEHIPTESFGEEVRYVWWRYLTFDMWNYDADRGRIAIIFSKLLSFK